jgi:Tfp pilus assembly protein PilX
MEEKRLLKREEGAALVTVLVAIIVLLPPTIVLATLALRWQRQSLDFRDRIAQDFAAEGVLAEARARLSGQGIDLAPNEGATFVPRSIEGIDARVRVSRAEDVVLTLDGRVLEGLAASSADLDQTGTDAEGRMVYQFRKLAIYLVEIDVSARASLPPIKLYGVLARLPDGSLQTLGLTRRR